MTYLKGDKGDKGATSLFLSQGAKKTQGDNSDTHLYRCVAMSSLSRAFQTTTNRGVI